MKSFQKLNEKLRKVIVEYGYIEPTEPQEEAIPKILDGRNVLIIAPTGSGKTEAALFPVMSKILDEEARGIRAIYITPLRALNRDILRRMQEIALKAGLTMEVRHGDTPETARRRQSIKPPQILITTPETLQAILPGKRMRKHLSKVKHVIIDEIHEFISDKRGAQLSLALERLREICGREYQRIGLSATIGNPWEAAKFLSGEGRDVEIVDSTIGKKIEVKVEAVTDDMKIEGRVDADIPETIIPRIKRIVELVLENGSTLLFTNTRETAEYLATIIRKMNPPFNIGVHHGSLSREERIRVEEEFKNGKIKLLICTSSLELGLDIGLVNYVIQYTSPRQTVNLIQRIGRAKHKLTETSKGTIISSTLDDILESAVLARRGVNGILEPAKIHEKALDVLAHQIVGLIMDNGPMNISDVKRVFIRAYPYRDISENEISEVASFLSSIGVVRYFKEDGTIKARGIRTWKYYYENLSVIPDVRRFKVISTENMRAIGELDEEFVAIHGEEPFILAGRAWRIINVDENEMKVYVEYMGDEIAAIPAWIGELIPVSMEAAMETADLREKIIGSEDLSEYPLTGEAIEYAKKILGEHLKCGIPIPTSNRVIVEGLGRIIVVHVPLGTNGNRTLAAILSSKITEKMRMNVRRVSDPYRVTLITPNPLNPESIVELIRGLDIDEESVNTLKNTHEYQWKLLHVARRMGVVEKDAKISRIKGLAAYLEDTVVEREALREAIQDYFDIEAVKRLLEEVRAGKVKVEAYKGRMDAEISPLTRQILIQALPQGLIPKGEAPLNIVDIVRERLQNREVILACIHCRRWMGKYKVKYLPEEIVCPKCGAKAIGATHREDILKILDKWHRGLKMNDDEKKSFEEFQKSISLIMSYGKRALIALAARGVGPTTAARILKGYFKTEEELYLQILEAEKEYLRTRMFWEE
jgi:ATP-dependent Lhr-like helicase